MPEFVYWIALAVAMYAAALSILAAIVDARIDDYNLSHSAGNYGGLREDYLFVETLVARYPVRSLLAIVFAPVLVTGFIVYLFARLTYILVAEELPDTFAAIIREHRRLKTVG